jgi:hypothetical protein
MVVVLLPLQVLLFRGIHAHYTQAADEIAAETPIDPDEITHQVIVPIASLNQIALQTLAYARSIARGPEDVVSAVHITDDPDAAERLQEQWEEWQCGVQLTIIESPYRSLVGPLLAYIDAMHVQHPGKTLTVVLPEMVPAHWWEQVLHNQTALRLKAALLFRPGIVVADVPYHLKRRSRYAQALARRAETEARSRRTEGRATGRPASSAPRRPRVVRPTGPPPGSQN